MQPALHPLLFGVFVVALALGAFSVVSNLVVFAALRRLGVPLSFGLSGVPGYLTRRCAQLPSSIARPRLLKLSLWSDLAFALAFVGVLSSLPLFD